MLPDECRGTDKAKCKEAILELYGEELWEKFEEAIDKMEGEGDGDPVVRMLPGTTYHQIEQHRAELCRRGFRELHPGGHLVQQGDELGGGDVWKSPVEELTDLGVLTVGLREPEGDETVDSERFVSQSED